jgi:hypothetical protein
MSRWRAGLLVAGLTLCGALGVGSLPVPDARVATTSPFFRVSPATSTDETEMRRLAAGGAGVARFSLNWWMVQPRADRPYDCSRSTTSSCSLPATGSTRCRS